MASVTTEVLCTASIGRRVFVSIFVSFCRIQHWEEEESSSPTGNASSYFQR